MIRILGLMLAGVIAGVIAGDVVSATPPAYVHLDGKWYEANTPPFDRVSYTLPGRVYMPTVSASMCGRPGGQTISGMSVYLGSMYFPVHQVAAIHIYNSAGGFQVFEISTVPGDVTCLGQVPDPRPDPLFNNGYEPLPLFANGFEWTVPPARPLDVTCGDGTTTAHSMTIDGLAEGYPVLLPEELRCGPPGEGGVPWWALIPGPHNPRMLAPADGSTVTLTQPFQLLNLRGAVDTWYELTDHCEFQVRPPPPLPAWPIVPAFRDGLELFTAVTLTESSYAGRYRVDMICHRIVGENHFLVPVATHEFHLVKP